MQSCYTFLCTYLACQIPLEASCSSWYGDTHISTCALISLRAWSALCYVAFVVVVLNDGTDLNKIAIGQIGGNHFNICFMFFLTKLICYQLLSCTCTCSFCELCIEWDCWFTLFIACRICMLFLFMFLKLALVSTRSWPTYYCLG